MFRSRSCGKIWQKWFLIDLRAIEMHIPDVIRRILPGVLTTATTAITIVKKHHRNESYSRQQFAKQTEWNSISWKYRKQLSFSVFIFLSDKCDIKLKLIRVRQMRYIPKMLKLFLLRTVFDYSMAVRYLNKPCHMRFVSALMELWMKWFVL